MWLSPKRATPPAVYSLLSPLHAPGGIGLGDFRKPTAQQSNARNHIFTEAKEL